MLKLAVLICLLSGAASASSPEIFSKFTHPPLSEVSGMVKSRQYDGLYWVLNDSGDEARIFGVKENGAVLMPPWEADDYFAGEPVEGKKAWPGVQVAGGVNIDFEDLAIDGDTLYVPDMGNNGNARRDLGVYVLPEPNPLAVMRTRPLKWLPVIYPDQAAFPGPDWHFDCEANFVFKGKLYFLTKRRAGGQYDKPEDSTALYRLDTAFTDKPNVLSKVEEKAGLKGWVTAADLSPDGKSLAVLCEGPERSAWIFEAPASGDRLLSGKAKRLLLPDARQCEAICFADGATLLVANEERELFRLKVADFRPQRP